MKRNIILISCVLVLAFVLGLGGFTLAGSERENAGQDRLIGVYVTPEYVDLFDFESYFNDNTNKLMSGGEITGGEAYEGRLYAVLQESVLTEVDTGAQTTVQEYVFPDLDGIGCYVPKIGQGDDSYTSSVSDSALDLKIYHVSYTDEGEGMTLEGTIYVTPGSGSNAWYTNPVYQTADGQVYLVSGDGISCGGVQGEGAVMSTTIADTSTITENGKAKSYSFSVTLAVSFAYAPERFTVVQMGAGGNCLDTAEFVPGEEPEAIAIQPGTEYLVVETHKTAPGGAPVITRELFTPDDTQLTLWRERGDGVLEQVWVELDW